LSPSLTPIIDIGQWDNVNRPVFKPGAGVTLATVYNKIRITQIRNVVDNLINDFNRLTLDGPGFLGWQGVKNGDNGSWSAFLPTRKSISRIIGNQTRRQNVIVNPRRFDLNAQNNSQVDTNEDFRLQFNFNDGQGADAYQTASGTIEYKTLDVFTLNITLYWNIAETTGTRTTFPEYVPIRWVLKVGSKYLEIGGTWTATETINEFWLTDFGRETDITIEGNFDTAVTTNTTTTFEIRVYDADPYRFDVESSSKAAFETDIKAVLTSTETPARLPGNRIVGRFNGGSGKTDYTAYFYELQQTLQTADDIAIIQPTDASFYRWKLISTFDQKDPTSNVVKSVYYLTNVTFKTFPDGQDIGETFVEDKVISTNNAKTLDYDLHHFDVDNTLNNTEQLILNFFKLANGNATGDWGASSKKTQDLVAGALLKRYKLPTRIINFDMVSDVEMTPFNVIRKVNDDNRIFQFNRLTIDDKRSEYQGEIEEISSDTGATADVNRAFDSGFDSGFS